MLEHQAGCIQLPGGSRHGPSILNTVANLTLTDTVIGLGNTNAGMREAKSRQRIVVAGWTPECGRNADVALVTGESGGVDKGNRKSFGSPKF